MNRTVHRYPERYSSDRDLLNALLDSQYFGVLSSVSADGEPWALPISYVRDGDRILFHGSTGGGLLRAAVGGAPVVFTVAVMDGLVVGQTAFDSSANYRSTTIRGRLISADGDDKAEILDRLTDGLIPGRMNEVRPHTKRELAATLALVLPITDDNWLYKQRQGQTEGPAEGETDYWSGIVPLHTRYGEPEPAPGVSAEIPASVKRLFEP